MGSPFKKILPLKIGLCVFTLSIFFLYFKTTPLSRFLKIWCIFQPNVNFHNFSHNRQIFFSPTISKFVMGYSITSWHVAILKSVPNFQSLLSFFVYFCQRGGLCKNTNSSIISVNFLKLEFVVAFCRRCNFFFCYKNRSTVPSVQAYRMKFMGPSCQLGIGKFKIFEFFIPKSGGVEKWNLWGRGIVKRW